MLHDIDRTWDTSINYGRRLKTITAPIYYASLLGLEEAFPELLNTGQVGSTTINVNVQGGYYGNALQAASVQGHKEVVQILLDNEADISALLVVLSEGHDGAI